MQKYLITTTMLQGQRCNKSRNLKNGCLSTSLAANIIVIFVFPKLYRDVLKIYNMLYSQLKI